MREELVRLEGISKTYSKITILENVNFNVLKGEVIGLLGATGAGKTTIVKILSGVIKKDGGTLYYNEEKVKNYSPQIAQKIGIFSIHQDENLIPNISIAENIFFVREDSKKSIILNTKDIIEETNHLFNIIGLDLNPKLLVKNLTLSQKQLVQIAKALSMEAKLIVMDETTSALNEEEILILKKVIKKLKERKVSIIFISHKMDEVLDISDRITIIRNGRSVGTFRSNIKRTKIISLMYGKKFKEFIPERSIDKFGKTVLTVDSFSTKKSVKNISFTLKQGEILGITGLIGSGRTELANGLFGITKKRKGSIYIEGKKVEINNPYDAIKNNIALVPENRYELGLMYSMTVKENINASILDKGGQNIFTNSRIQDFISRKYIKKLDIECSNDTRIDELDGSNQQKVLLAKWLAVKPKILILDEPTKGVDTSTKEKIYSVIAELAESNTGVIIISSELREIAALCDKAIVLKKGRVIGEIEGRDLIKRSISNYV